MKCIVRRYIRSSGVRGHLLGDRIWGDGRRVWELKGEEETVALVAFYSRPRLVVAHMRHPMDAVDRSPHH